MLKRRPSDIPSQSQPDSKRCRAESERADNQISRLSDELVLRVLKHVEFQDILAARKVSRWFQTIADDSGIWRDLYYERFLRPRTAWLSRAKRRQLEQNQPHRYARWLDEQDLIRKGPDVDWKRQYKVRHNWARGSAAVNEIPLSSRAPLPQQLARLQSGIIYTADSKSGLRAWSYIEQPSLLAHAPLTTGVPNEAPTPSAMAIEPVLTGSSRHEIILGFEDGSYRLYEYCVKTKAFRQVFVHAPSSAGMITACALLHPYLATINESQTLSVYKQTNHNAEPRLVASLKSHTIWPPLALGMRPQKDNVLLSVAYCIPSYTAGWSVGLQELAISRFDGALCSSRTASAIDDLFKPLSSSDLPPKPQASRSSPRDVSYAHPYLLVTHSDNTMTLYSVLSAVDKLVISARRRLFGHTSCIFGAEVEKRGKAVSVSVCGDEVRIWELEGQPMMRTGRSISESTLSVQVTAESARPRVLGEARTVLNVGFDAEHVVVVRERETAGQQALTVYDFA